MADIRIDRYEFDVSGFSGTLTIANVGNIANAFINHGGNSTRSSGGPTGSTGNASPADCGVGLEITGTTTITYTSGNAIEKKIMFEVWVYTGPLGGAYEFIVRQRGSMDITNGNTNTTSAINGMLDRNQSIPMYTGFSSTINSNNNWHQATLTVRINNADMIDFSRNNTGGGGTVTPFYEIVEFTGSAWRVYTAISISHNTGNNVAGAGGDVRPLVEDSRGFGSPKVSIDWTTTAIMQVTMEGDSGADGTESGLSDVQMMAIPSGDEVRLTLDNSSSRNDGTAYCYALQCDDMVVSRDFQFNINEGNGTYGTELSFPAGVNGSTPLSELGLEKFFCTSGEGTAHARGALVGQITATGIEHWVHRQGNTVSAAFAVIDVSGMVTVIGSTGQIKYWDGSSWIAKPVKHWNGSSWEIKPMKHWNGSSFIETNY